MVGTYKFGQFRSNQISTYMKPLQYTLDNKKVESSLSKGTIFLDKAMELSGANQLQGQNEQGKMKSFYLRFKVYKKSEPQVYSIILRNTTLLKDNVQTIDTIQVDAGDESEFATFDFVFTPNENRIFNQIHFELQRTVLDYNIQNDDGTFGRKAEMEITAFNEIVNITPLAKAKEKVIIFFLLPLK